MTIEKAKILDDTLTRFNGNKTISWDSLREEFKNNWHKYHVLENNINFLIGDGMLKRNLVSPSMPTETLVMTDKGFATFTDPKNLGYVIKAKKERLDALIKYSAFFITLATFLILCYNSFFKTR